MKAEIEAVRCILGDAQMPLFWNIFAALEKARSEGYAAGAQAVYMQDREPELPEQPSDAGYHNYA